MSNINQRLNGLDVFAYMGTNAAQPTDFRTQSFDPTSNDSRNFYLGTWWLNTSTLALWYLASLTGNVANWQRVTLAGIETLTGNTGGAVAADNAGNINVVGDAVTITVAGNPGTNTLTISSTGITASSFPTDAGTATPALGVLNILGGVAGRNINTTGAGNTVRVNMNNDIELGDLASIIGSDALLAVTGDVSLTGGNINMPDTNAAGTLGIIKFGGDRFISNRGSFNTFVGELSGNTTLTTGLALGNTGVGTNCSASLTTGSGNSYYASGTGFNTTSGTDNCGFGLGVLSTLTDGTANSGFGTGCLQLANGLQNCAFGDSSGKFLTTGNYNTLIGGAGGGAVGLNYTSSESSNILIMNNGVTGESNVIRIGATGSGDGQQNKLFAAGIRGVTTGVADAVAVLIDSAGQLGTVSSSKRFKENIEDMGSYSEDLMDLRPVTFNYKEHSPKDRSVGLIAEEVEMVMPDLVIYDDKGLPQTVKYHDLVPMLLNELQKVSRTVMTLEVRIEELESKF